MALKLQLVENGSILFEMPLNAERWTKSELRDELDRFEEEFDRYASFFDALSNEGRLRMMKRLFEDDDLTLSFADFMRELSLNPKIVWESTKKLTESLKSLEYRFLCNERESFYEKLYGKEK